MAKGKEKETTILLCSTMVPYLFIFSLVASVVHGGTNCGTYTASDGTMYNLTLLTKYVSPPSSPTLFTLDRFTHTLSGPQLWVTQYLLGPSPTFLICVITIPVCFILLYAYKVVTPFQLLKHKHTAMLQLLLIK